MKRITVVFLSVLLITSHFIFGCAFAETIQNVDFQVPQDWKEGNKIEHKKGSTVYFFPAHWEKGEEIFVVHANTLSSDGNNPSGIKKGLSTKYPINNIDLQVLDTTKDGILYEWNVSENGLEKVHGWGRVFATKEGTVMLMYHTENIADIAQAQSIWMPILKAAHYQPR